MAKVLTKADATDYLEKIHGYLTKAVDQMPTHREFVSEHCPMKDAG